MYTPSPCVFNQYQMACRLNSSETTFKVKLPKLVAAGFPQYDELLGGWSVPAVERWIELRAGLGGTNENILDSEIMEAINGR